jgi:peptide/nickel transport system substrate-binding protein
VVWGGDGGLDVVLEPRWYFPYSNESNFAQAWRTWYNPMANPRTAPEEPPQATRKQMELYDQLKATADERQQADLMKQILDIAADQFYVLGISLPPRNYGIVKNNFHNVPQTMPNAWLYPHPAPTNPSQYFVE